jgi:hypothetical protein
MSQRVESTHSLYYHESACNGKRVERVQTGCNMISPIVAYCSPLLMIGGGASQ